MERDGALPLVGCVRRVQALSRETCALAGWCAHNSTLHPVRTDVQHRLVQLRSAHFALPLAPAAAAAGSAVDLLEFVFQQLQKKVGIITAVVEVRCASRGCRCGAGGGGRAQPRQDGATAHPLWAPRSSKWVCSRLSCPALPCPAPPTLSCHPAALPPHPPRRRATTSCLGCGSTSGTPTASSSCASCWCAVSHPTRLAW